MHLHYIQERGKFPSQPQPNPKGQFNSNANSSGSQHIDQVKLVLTLHSGKVVEKPLLDPYEEDEESFLKSKEGKEPTTTEGKIKPSLAPLLLMH